jgi:chaperonin cofactor prefoldin
MLYTISFQNENKLLAEELLNLFDIKKISQNDNLKILEYIEELDIIFDKQSNFLTQIKNLHSENFENYLIKFYTIHIYYLNEIKQKEKLSKVLNDLINNNIFDKLILPKLYLSDFYFYYKTLVISDEVKNMLFNNLINISKNFNDINNSFSLISDFFSMKFDVILLSVNNNYDKISLICKNENQSLNLNNYFNHNNEEKDKLLNIKEYLNFILDKKKETLFEAINIDINSYIYYITNDYSLDFLTFLELKLLESVISYKNIEDALLFSSNIKYKNFAPLLEIIIKYSEMFIKICQKSQKVIYIQKYIEQKNEDNLLNIQNLISNIIEIEKKESYQFIKFTANIWAPYLKFASFEGMKIIRKTLWICKEIDNAIDEEEIHLSTSIHNLGLELIKKGQLKGENLLQFLGEDELFYANKKIKDLEFENTKTNKRIDNLNSQIEKVQNEIKDLKREINSLSNSNNNLEKRVNKLENKVSDLKYSISSIINH